MCAAVNFDFILILINFDFIFCNSDVNFVLYYNLLLYFIQLEMHVRLICAIKFYLLTYLQMMRTQQREGYWCRCIVYRSLLLVSGRGIVGHDGQLAKITLLTLKLNSICTAENIHCVPKMETPNSWRYNNAVNSQRIFNFFSQSDSPTNLQ